MVGTDELIKVIVYILLVAAGVGVTLLCSNPREAIRGIKKKELLVPFAVVVVSIICAIFNIVYSDGVYLGDSKEETFLSVLNGSADMFELVTFGACRLLAMLVMVLVARQLVVAYGFANSSLLYILVLEFCNPCIYAVDKWSLSGSVIFLLMSCLVMIAVTTVMYGISVKKLGLFAYLVILVAYELWISNFNMWGVVFFGTLLLEMMIILFVAKYARILRNVIRRVLVFAILILMIYFNCRMF